MSNNLAYQSPKQAEVEQGRQAGTGPAKHFNFFLFSI
jgi:hypothetical protein